eukprot:SAG31_NODE_372_length_16598_cov_44.705982_2_plen_244_part_00
MVDELAERDGRRGACLPSRGLDAFERRHHFGAQLADAVSCRAVLAVLERLAVQEARGHAARVDRDGATRCAPRHIFRPVALRGAVVHVPGSQGGVVHRGLFRRGAVEVLRLRIVARRDDGRLPARAAAAAHAADLVPVAGVPGAARQVGEGLVLPVVARGRAVHHAVRADGREEPGEGGEPGDDGPHMTSSFSKRPHRATPAGAGVMAAGVLGIVLTYCTRRAGRPRGRGGFESVTLPVLNLI